MHIAYRQTDTFVWLERTQTRRYNWQRKQIHEPFKRHKSWLQWQLSWEPSIGAYTNAPFFFLLCPKSRLHFIFCTFGLDLIVEFFSRPNFYFCGGICDAFAYYYYFWIFLWVTYRKVLPFALLPSTFELLLLCSAITNVENWNDSVAGRVSAFQLF